MGGSVRFSELVKTAGPPEVYLPLADPMHDRSFTRALQEERLLSLKQEPVGTKKDFGTVGFLKERYVSYLIFPKPLTRFNGKRVVGIKYDALQDGKVLIPRVKTAVARRSVKPAAPKPKPRPRPKRFTATVRLTSTNEVQVTVKAFDENEARIKAEEAARGTRRLSAPKVESELLHLSKGK